ncbi:hypothetical protein DUI87_25052 [Hirundo rustica rustica]|uniref:Uncharacterized protein n=1 Tax=Hirundo rustica rustica TaxID=333673 RepID=A0A3M0JIJ3_HIRRU|nr:hypothetical protein DUI87_25052 [Hirundo rustica rustica]
MDSSSDSSSDNDGSSDNSEEERVQQFLELQKQVARLVWGVGVVQWVLLKLGGLGVMAQNHGLSSCVRVDLPAVSAAKGSKIVWFQEKTQRNLCFSDWPFLLGHRNLFPVAEICCLHLGDVLTVGPGDTT